MICEESLIRALINLGTKPGVSVQYSFNMFAYSHGIAQLLFFQILILKARAGPVTQGGPIQKKKIDQKKCLIRKKFKRFWTELNR